MSSELDKHGGAIVQLRAYLAQQGLAGNARLPAERELSEILGVSRGDLRKALAVLEEEGQIWRHVGKGTFLGKPPVEEMADLAAIARGTSPSELMHARRLIEPTLAREAALHASAEDVAEMRRIIVRTRAAQTWRQYESQDNELHRSIARATHNLVLVALFDLLNTVRRTVVWGRLRAHAERPPDDHHSFREHDRIVDSIAERDLDAAEAGMRTHLRSVQHNLIEAHQHRIGEDNE
jgi:DNA-binding FadR family transcriptional regulator